MKSNIKQVFIFVEFSEYIIKGSTWIITYAGKYSISEGKHMNISLLALFFQYIPSNSTPYLFSNEVEEKL